MATARFLYIAFSHGFCQVATRMGSYWFERPGRLEPVFSACVHAVFDVEEELDSIALKPSVSDL
jgi:hypothetical protein